MCYLSFSWDSALDTTFIGAVVRECEGTAFGIVALGVDEADKALLAEIMPADRLSLSEMQ
jgi:hypothetical protein